MSSFFRPNQTNRPRSPITMHRRLQLLKSYLPDWIITIVLAWVMHRRKQMIRILKSTQQSRILLAEQRTGIQKRVLYYWHFVSWWFSPKCHWKLDLTRVLLVCAIREWHRWPYLEGLALIFIQLLASLRKNVFLWVIYDLLPNITPSSTLNDNPM